jgi:hypothetical protein
MALRLSLNCPVDGLVLTTNAPIQIKGDTQREGLEHLHIEFPRAPMTCANGHRWRIVGDVKLTRD